MPHIATPDTDGSRGVVVATASDSHRGAEGIADGRSRQLDPRYIPLERVVGQITTAILSLVVAGIVLVVVMVTSLPLAVDVVMFGAWATATLACAWLAHRWPEREYVRASYTIADEVIEIRTWVWWRHVTKVSRSRVQHTDVAQGPVERRYGLATLVIHTAGTEHARVALKGLAHETALAIRDQLLPHQAADAV
ncbi:MAG TPA: PH domain-containing protein [Kofleriaceae bacterium]|nr:PH domain-containing protein [Kofleriaceae bacterium]